MDRRLIRELYETPLPEPERGRRWWPFLLAGAVLALGTGLWLTRGDGTPPVTTATTMAASTTTTTTAPVRTVGWMENRFLAQVTPVGGEILFTGGGEQMPYGRIGDVSGATWAFDVATEQWYEYPASPLAERFGHAIATDPDGGLVYVFGGTSRPPSICGLSGLCADDPRGDTVAFDPASGTWASLEAEGAPSARYGAAMTFDPEAGRIILFGGATRAANRFSNETLADTWEFDPATTRWTRLDTATTPPARAWHALAYDSINGRILLVGGAAAGGTLDTEVWAFDGTDWDRVGEAGPSPRWIIATAFDSHSKALVLIGGHGTIERELGSGTATDLGFLYDAWAFDVVTDRWRQLGSRDFSPIWAMAAYDNGTDLIVVHTYGVTAMFDVDREAWQYLEPPPE